MSKFKCEINKFYKVLSIDTALKNIGIFYGDVRKIDYSLENIYNDLQKCENLNGLYNIVDKVTYIKPNYIDTLELVTNTKGMTIQKKLVAIKCLMESLDEYIEEDPDLIILERPPPRNKMITSVVFLLSGYLASKFPKAHLDLVTGSLKEHLKFNFEFMNPIEEKYKDKYAQRKYSSICRAMEITKTFPEDIQYELNDIKKKDDFSDAMLQSIAYIYNH